MSYTEATRNFATHSDWPEEIKDPEINLKATILGDLVDLFKIITSAVIQKKKVESRQVPVTVSRTRKISNMSF